jgi:hypothetical protein
MRANSSSRWSWNRWSWTLVAGGAPILKGAHGREPILVPSMDGDLVAFVDQRLRGCVSETVSGAGNEDTHGLTMTLIDSRFAIAR